MNIKKYIKYKNKYLKLKSLIKTGGEHTGAYGEKIDAEIDSKFKIRLGLTEVDPKQIYDVRELFSVYLTSYNSGTNPPNIVLRNFERIQAAFISINLSSNTHTGPDDEYYKQLQKVIKGESSLELIEQFIEKHTIIDFDQIQNLLTQEMTVFPDVMPTIMKSYGKKNHAISLIAVNIDGMALELVDPDTPKYERIIWAAVNQNGMALQHLPLALRSYRDLVLLAVNQNGLALQFADPNLKKDEEIITDAVRQNGLALQYALITESISTANDRGLLRRMTEIAVNQNGLALQYTSAELRGDEAIVRSAIVNNGLSLQFAVPHLQRQLGLFGAESERIIRTTLNSTWAFNAGDPTINSDVNFLLGMIRRNIQCFRFVSPALKNNRHFIIRALQINGLILEYLSDEQRKNPNLVVHAIFQNGNALKFSHRDMGIIISEQTEQKKQEGKKEQKEQEGKKEKERTICIRNGVIVLIAIKSIVQNRDRITFRNTEQMEEQLLNLQQMLANCQFIALPINIKNRLYALLSLIRIDIIKKYLYTNHEFKIWFRHSFPQKYMESIKSEIESALNPSRLIDLLESSARKAEAETRAALFDDMKSRVTLAATASRSAILAIECQTLAATSIKDTGVQQAIKKLSDMAKHLTLSSIIDQNEITLIYDKDLDPLVASTREALASSEKDTKSKEIKEITKKRIADLGLSVAVVKEAGKPAIETSVAVDKEAGLDTLSELTAADFEDYVIPTECSVRTKMAINTVIAWKALTTIAARTASIIDSAYFKQAAEATVVEEAKEATVAKEATIVMDTMVSPDIEDWELLKSKVPRTLSAIALAVRANDAVAKSVELVDARPNIDHPGVDLESIYQDWLDEDPA